MKWPWFDRLLQSWELPSTIHVYAVADLLAACLLLHLVVLFVIWLRLKRRRTALRAAGPSAINADFSQDKFQGFAWISWVQRRFFGRRRPDPNTDRASALEELDAQLLADGWLLFLHRLHSFGPMLGVLLTTVGFLTVDFQHDETLAVKDLFPLVMKSILPLSLGMAAGVTIALFNIGCQHVADVFVNRLRSEARFWLDDVVLPEVFKDRRADAFDDPVRLIAGQMGHVERHFDLMASSLDGGVKDLKTVLGEFGRNLTAVTSRLDYLPQRFDSMTGAADRLAEAATGLISRGGGTLGRLEDLAKHLETQVNVRLDQCTESMVRSAHLLETMVGKLDGQGSELSKSAVAVLAGSEAQTAAFQELQRMIQGRLLPTHEKLDLSVSGLLGAMSQLTEPLGELHTEVKATSSSLSKVFKSFENLDGGLGTAINGFSDTVTQLLVPACQQHANVTRDNAAAVQKLDEGILRLQEGVSMVGRIATILDQQQVSVTKGMDGVQATLERAGSASDSLRVLLDEHWHPLWRNVAATVSTMRDSSREINATVTTSVEPAMQSLGQLTQIVQRLEKILTPLLNLTRTDELVQSQMELIEALAGVETAIRRVPRQEETRPNNRPGR